MFSVNRKTVVFKEECWCRSWVKVCNQTKLNDMKPSCEVDIKTVKELALNVKNKTKLKIQNRQLL